MIKTRSYDILINHCLCVACYVYTLIVVGGGAGRRSARIMTRCLKVLNHASAYAPCYFN